MNPPSAHHVHDAALQHHHGRDDINTPTTKSKNESGVGPDPANPKVKERVGAPAGVG